MLEWLMPQPTVALSVIPSVSRRVVCPTISTTCLGVQYETVAPKHDVKKLIVAL
jgi:hypothetical protein